ncbi:MAG: thioredoxin-disulfide reductase [Patescibacteria group bacterium]|nr:thioredoxin-disulfide reductase [Patescibacteria group bacterium]
MSEFFTNKPKEGESWDIVIIGSGPSAFTAAIYTTRGALSTLVIAGEKWGGQLMNTSIVDNFPGFPEGILGPDLMINMKKQAERFGAEVLTKYVTKVDFSKKVFEIFSGNDKYLTKSVIIATGALIKWLGVKGEKELIGKGVSTCAPCDAPFFKNKKVAVVGGGDSAMEEAHILTKYASEVILIHRKDLFRATEAMQERIKNNPKIKIFWNTEVTEVLGDKRLEAVKILNNKDNKSSELKLDGLFVAIGHKPDSDIFKGQLEMDDKGFILAKDFHCGTSTRGVFVAGDVLDKDYKQAIVAAGSGCIAAMEAIKFLDQNQS